MTSRFLTGVLVAASCDLCRRPLIVVARAADEPRAPRNAAEFDALFQQVKNWGRWGADDELGSVNLVTAAKRKQAAALVKTGDTVSLAHNPLTETAPDNARPFEHTMLPGFSMDRYAVVVSRLRAQPHRRALPHPLQGSDLQRLRARRRQHRQGLHEARHPEPEEGHRHARRPRRYPASAEPAVSRAGHADLRRGSRSVGKEVGREDRVGRRGAGAHRTLGEAREAGAVERRPERGRPPRLRRAVDQGARRGASRRRRRLRRRPVDGRRHRAAAAHADDHRRSASTCWTTRIWKRSARPQRRLNRWEFMLTINPVPVTGGTGFPLNAIAMF